MSIVGSGVGSLQLRALEKEHATLQREHAAMSAAHGELQLTTAALRERNDQLVEMRDAAQALAAQNAAAAQASHVALEQLRAQKEEQQRAAREEALSHFARSAELERRLNDSQMEAARALEGERRALGRQQELEAEVTTLAAEAETSAGHLRRLCEERASSFSSRMDDLASSSSAGGSPAVGSRARLAERQRLAAADRRARHAAGCERRHQRPPRCAAGRSAAAAARTCCSRRAAHRPAGSVRRFRECVLWRGGVCP